VILIPAIDLRGGRCVRLYQGDFAAETRYEAEPAEVAQRYRDLGATWLHVVDLDGARDGAPANRAVIEALATRGGLHLQVGGGVRSAAVLEELLAAGIDRVLVGSAALESIATVEKWLALYGPARVVLVFDVRTARGRDPVVLTRGWSRDSGVPLWSALERYVPRGLAHVLCTDTDRDGTLTGPNVELYAEAVQRFPQIAWQASGGIRDARDLAALANVGVSAAVSGKALLEDRIPAEELRPFLPDASFPVSTSATARS
jgi:phosphoribosylformimino-5-aminoimidazole carboxamide ribotide isomerase